MISRGDTWTIKISGALNIDLSALGGMFPGISIGLGVAFGKDGGNDMVAPFVSLGFSQSMQVGNPMVKGLAVYEAWTKFKDSAIFVQINETRTQFKDNLGKKRISPTFALGGSMTVNPAAWSPPGGLS